MAAFAEGDVTVAITRKEDINGLKEVWGTLTFGAGAETYATGGIPLDKKNFGFVKQLISFIPTSCSTDYIVEYTIATALLKLKYCDYNASGDDVPIEYANGGNPATTVVGFHTVGI
jgi:hypothetical protein